MTPEQEHRLVEDIGKIKEGIAGLSEQVGRHVDDDRRDFRGVHYRVTEVKQDLERDVRILKEDVQAETKVMRDDLKRHAGRIAVFSAGGGVIVAVALILGRQIAQMVFGG